jgi:hypothetical protein
LSLYTKAKRHGLKLESAGKDMAEETSVMQVIPKLVDFILWIIPALDKFPKSQKFLLGDRIETGLLDVLDKLIEANYSREKIVLLRRANLQLEKIRYLLRIAYKLRCFDVRRYEFASKALIEVGRMIGGWIKAAGNRV